MTIALRQPQTFLRPCIAQVNPDLVVVLLSQIIPANGNKRATHRASRVGRGLVFALIANMLSVVIRENCTNHNYKGD